MALDARHRLRNYMEFLSRKYFHANWHDGLEYALWHWMNNQLELEPAEGFRLYQLHISADGWFAEEDDSVKFIDSKVWSLHFDGGDW